MKLPQISSQNLFTMTRGPQLKLMISCDLPFFMPRGLNRLEFRFVGFRGIAGKTRELGDPFVHVRKADGVRIEIGEFVGQRDAMSSTLSQSKVAA